MRNIKFFAMEHAVIIVFVFGLAIGLAWNAATAHARVSLTQLQAEIEALQVENAAQQAEIDANSNVINTMVDQSCPSGQAVVGMDAAGNFICGNFKLSCLNGDPAGSNGGCLLQTVCGKTQPEAFASGNCSTNTAQFADWWCQLGGYSHAIAYTEIGPSGYITYQSLYYNGGSSAVLSNCSQVLGPTTYGFTSNCSGVLDLECAN